MKTWRALGGGLHVSMCVCERERESVCVSLCVQFAFFLAVGMVPFRKQAFFPNLQMSANSILPRREKNSLL